MVLDKIGSTLRQGIKKISNAIFIDKKLIDEIIKKSEELTYEHNWIKSDLIMLDNRRFMHGRRAFGKHIKRDIVIMQTERASFGYGATIRKQINSNKR